MNKAWCVADTYYISAYFSGISCRHTANTCFFLFVLYSPPRPFSLPPLPCWFTLFLSVNSTSSLLPPPSSTPSELYFPLSPPLPSLPAPWLFISHAYSSLHTTTCLSAVFSLQVERQEARRDGMTEHFAVLLFVMKVRVCPRPHVPSLSNARSHPRSTLSRLSSCAPGRVRHTVHLRVRVLKR